MTIDADTRVPAGLVELSLADVQGLLRAVESGRLPCPLDVVALRAEGFGRLVGAMGSLLGLDRGGVRAVLSAVSAAPGSTASLHAKCVVVDGARALVTSANFTDRGQTRNIEAGLLVASTETAERLEGQWWSLVRAGLLRRMP